MIQNEVAILRRVKHPNIVLLIEEVDTYNELYLVMELVKVCVCVCAVITRLFLCVRASAALVVDRLRYLAKLRIKWIDVFSICCMMVIIISNFRGRRGQKSI